MRISTNIGSPQALAKPSAKAYRAWFAVFNEPPVYPGRFDPNARFRERRRAARRRRALRRLALLSVIVAGIVAVALNARFSSGGDDAAQTARFSSSTTGASETLSDDGVERPPEIRGVHVTGPLVAAGKLDDYIALKDAGLNTLQIDLKDESGDVGLTQAPALADKIGASRDYFDARKVARKAHEAGLYVIGRIVVFEDPKLAEGRPDLALQHADGSIWKDSSGWSWVSQYSREVWEYNVEIAKVALRAGFDEIMFDYVRFPSDDVTGVVFPDRVAEPRWRTIANFAKFADESLSPSGARIGAALFGLAATKDLGIGQRPRLLARSFDTIYPMTYPCLYGPGWYGLDAPWATPGLTVSWSLSHFTEKLAGSQATLVPWLEDYDCEARGVEYTPELVAQQVSAARRAHTDGFLLWNAHGEYTPEALSPR